MDDQTRVGAHRETPKSTQKIIDGSPCRLEPETLHYVKASHVGHPERHHFVCQDAFEITVATTDEGLADLTIISRNPERWRMFSITCSNPVYCVGFLAAIAVPMRDADIDILLVSTFTRDLVFVKAADVHRAAAILDAAGFQPQM